MRAMWTEPGMTDAKNGILTIFCMEQKNKEMIVHVIKMT